jgi:uncharacterized protein (TIGR02646 family)
MHRLTRGPAPACLAGFRHGANTWADVTPAQKPEIWAFIEAMQGARCAYCEAGIAGDDRHIEHFVQKGRDPTQTFVWANLFGSCNREDSCGKFKDRKGRPYADADLIKPDTEDPEQALVFDAHGSVRPRHGLSPAQTNRASETIRVFNLNGVLKAIRRSEVAGYVQTAEEIAEFFDLDPALGQQALTEEFAATAHLPFATAIKHVLSNQSA